MFSPPYQNSHYSLYVEKSRPSADELGDVATGDIEKKGWVSFHDRGFGYKGILSKGWKPRVDPAGVVSDMQPAWLQSYLWGWI